MTASSGVEYKVRRVKVIGCCGIMAVGAVLGIVYGLWAPWPWNLSDAIGGVIFGFGVGSLLAYRKTWQRRDAERDDWNRRIFGK